MTGNQHFTQKFRGGPYISSRFPEVVDTVDDDHDDNVCDKNKTVGLRNIFEGILLH